MKNIALVPGGFVDGTGWEGDQARSCRTGRPRNSRRSFLWRGGNYRSRKRFQSCGTRLHNRLCPDKGESVASLINIVR
jgi:hypothetical protein